MRLLLALALLLPTAPPAAPRSDAVVYEFEWRSLATLSRWQAGETVTDRGELYGRGPLSLQWLSDGSAKFEFTSPVGVGYGRIFGRVSRAVVFPTALAVGRPPAPHLSGGSFEPIGDSHRPESFELSYAEGFICRTIPVRCGKVTAWSRELSGTATIVR